MGYFKRSSDYQSDYEDFIERGGYTKTDGHGSQHNALSYDSDSKEGPHEHVWYDPKSGRAGWHGSGYETKHNK